jgi:hypothetical protein
VGPPSMGPPPWQLGPRGRALALNEVTAGRFSVLQLFGPPGPGEGAREWGIGLNIDRYIY